MRRSVAAFWLAVALVSLVLRSGFPTFGVGFAVDDDALFIRLAGGLAAGHWLGSYGELTFVKGMFYPAFIAVVHALGVRLPLAEQAVYLLGSATVAVALARSGRVGLATVLFTALALDPVVWTPPLARVIREGLYIGQSVAIPGLLALLILPGARDRRSRVGRFGLGAVFGLVLASFWLTREEGVWILPGLAVMLLARGVGMATSWRDGSSQLRMEPLLGAVLLSVAAFVVPIETVRLLNRHFYGRAITVDVKNADFLHGYGAIARIGHNSFRRYVVFPPEARALAYRVSPAARALAPTLEGQGGANWRAVGCAQMRVPSCDEVLAGWFQWELRDAVAAAGHYRTLPDTLDFYRRLASDIDAGCAARKIACLAPRATLSPPFRTVYAVDALRLVPRELGLVLRLGVDDIGHLPSVGSPASLEPFRRLTGPIEPVAGVPVPRFQAVITGAARAIGAVMGFVIPVLFVLGVPGIMLGLAIRPAEALGSPVWLLAAGALVAVFTRVALLCYLDVSAIPSINTLYSAPAMPLAIVVAVLGTATGFDALRRALQTRALISGDGAPRRPGAVPP